MCKHVGCVGCPMGVPGIQSSHGVAGSTCEANVWAWQLTHQSCRQQCTAVQQQLLASVMGGATKKCTGRVKARGLAVSGGFTQVISGFG